MKKLTGSSEDIFAMSKIMDKFAIPSISADIGKFVYFSESDSSHRPVIKFYGGTKDTSSAKNAPALKYNKDGVCEVELADWMDNKNCPNAFDNEYINRLTNFIQNYKSILLLVWFEHLDESYALAYFHGQISLKQLFSEIDYDLPDYIETLEQLDEFCIENDLYDFDQEE